MEDDESGLELSLGLGLRDSSSKSKSRNGSFSDLRTEDGDKGIRIEDDNKHLFHGNSSRQDILSSRRNEGLFTDLSKTDSDADANEPKAIGSGGLWDLTSHNSLFNHPEARGSESDNKSARNVNHLKKRIRDDSFEEFSVKKSPYISLTAEERPVADNEDVAESKFAFGYGGLDSNQMKRPNPNSSSGALFSAQSPFAVKEPNPAPGSSSSSNLNLFNMLQLMPTSNVDQQKTGNPGNSPVAFGYPRLQLPLLDKNVPWLMNSHSKSVLDKHKDCVKAHQDPNKDEGPSSCPEEDNSKQGEEPISDMSAIKPGILAEVKFGGSGSCPSLPWVSATGSGPNGRTISGVTYRFNANQVKIVCACHGSHMSADEFVHHASDENANPSNNAAPPFDPSSPAASAQS